MPVNHLMEEKPASYYAQERGDLVAQLPRPLGSVLDVGCGSGGAGRLLRAAGATRLTGVELHAPSAQRARELYDAVHVGRAEEIVPTLDEAFDTFVLYDLLEHLADPGGLLLELRRVAENGAHLHVSVPNARHFSLLRDLALRGTFGYAEWGHRDSTHLRWFTRGDLVALLEGSGWSVERVTHGSLRPISRLAERVSRGLTAEFLVVQWAALARAHRSGPGGPRSHGAAGSFTAGGAPRAR